MEERHPVIQGYIKLLESLNQQLDSLLSEEADQWETIKDRIDRLCDLLERDGLMEDVVEIVEQIAAFYQFCKDSLADMAADTDDVSLSIRELQSMLDQLQRKITAAPQEKLEVAALAWKFHVEELSELGVFAYPLQKVH